MGRTRCISRDEPPVELAQKGSPDEERHCHGLRFDSVALESERLALNWMLVRLGDEVEDVSQSEPETETSEGKTTKATGPH